MAQYGPKVLDSIINRMIIQQACEKQGISVKESEIKQEVNDIAARFNLPVDAWYQMLKAEQPSPLAKIEGCAFRGRCPKAGDICKTKDPALAGDSHEVACHFPRPAQQGGLS